MTTRTRSGISLALIAAAISGVSVYLNKTAVTFVGDALLLTTLKNTLVGCLFLGYAIRVYLKNPGAIRRLSLRDRMGLIAVAFVGGSIPFLFFFEGLSLAAAPGAALIHKSLFIWVALLAGSFLGERPGKWILAGLGLLAAGQLLSGPAWARAWGTGETLILIATLLWAVETILVKRLLPAVPVHLAAAARMAGGAAVMWVVLLVRHSPAGLDGIGWAWVALTSVFLVGYVAAWYGALAHAPATIVTGLLPLGAVITAGVEAVVAGGTPAAAQGLGLAAIVAGAILLARFGLRSAQALQAAPAGSG